jgi:hypothetical protein
MKPFLEANKIDSSDRRWWTRNKDGKPLFIGYQLFDESMEKK